MTNSEKLIWPKMRVSSPNSALPVFSDEKKSVDSNAMRPTQMAAGHQARRRLGRDAVDSVFNSAIRPRPSFRRVVRSFARDHHVVNVAFAQAGGADAHESSLLLQLTHGLTATISHARFQPAYHLVHDHRHRTAIGHAPFNSFRHQFAQPV